MTKTKSRSLKSIPNIDAIACCPACSPKTSNAKLRAETFTPSQLTMSPAALFRISLMLPIVLPLLALPFGENAAFGILLLALGFGGAQYIIFAIWLFFAIGRKKSSAEIQKLSAISPLLFVPIQAIGWVVWGYYERLSNPAPGGIWDPIIVFSVYTIAVGYFYVGIVNLAFLACRQHGFIRDTPVR